MKRTLWIMEEVCRYEMPVDGLTGNQLSFNFFAVEHQLITRFAFCSADVMCFLASCAVLCSDEECEGEVLFDRTFDKNVVFSMEGLITQIDEGDGRFILYVEKKNSKVSLSLS